MVAEMAGSPIIPQNKLARKKYRMYSLFAAGNDLCFPSFAGMTKRTYVEAVLEGIKQCQEEGLDIDVRYVRSSVILSSQQPRFILQNCLFGALSEPRMCFFGDYG